MGPPDSMQRAAIVCAVLFRTLFSCFVYNARQRRGSANAIIRGFFLDGTEQKTKIVGDLASISSITAGINFLVISLCLLNNTQVHYSSVLCYMI